jgi:hypothetical protein
LERHQAVESGRWIFVAWKHLRRYDANAISRMGATAHAGRAADLLGRLRMLQRYDVRGLGPLATDAGISSIELSQIILPALEVAGGLRKEVDAGGVLVSVLPLAVDQDDVMAIASSVWEAMLPAPDERGALEVLRASSELPRPAVELVDRCLGAGLTEEQAASGIELATAVGLVRRRHVGDLDEDLYFNEYLWGDSIERTAEALGRLPTTVKEGLVSLLDELHQVEGRPASAIESASPELVRFAVENGIIEQTDIVTSDGRSASFSFTPRMRGYGVAKDEIPDELDQIRLVIASFSFAKHHATNRLDDPVSFLSRLIEDGRAGRARPIATDYGALEKQQIVSVEPIFEGAWAHRFVVIKRDSLVIARDTMVAGEVVGAGAISGDGGGLLDSRHFRDPVHARLRLGRESGSEPLHQANLLAAVRDAAQRTRPRAERL